MKIVITGARGFMGRNLALSLRSHYHTVFTPTRDDLDMKQLGSVLHYFGGEKFDAIIHCAGKVGVGRDLTYDEYLENIAMYENLRYIVTSLWPDIPVIFIGSGAEYDRRFNLYKYQEKEVFNCWPIDLYGLSKNIITRRALSELKNAYVLRLFGCFGHDEALTRFIRRSIIRLKNGKPIEIKNNRQMDYFYIGDVGVVVDYVLKTKLPQCKNLNLVYEYDGGHKWYLNEIGKMICKSMGMENQIVISSPANDMAYTGEGSILNALKLPLTGIEAGIQQVVNELK